MRLAELERTFQAHVLGDGEPAPALLDAVRAPARERLGIYAEAYRLRLIEALATQYPGLAARLGRAGFAALAQAFVRATPSRHRSIRDYGAGLADFIACAAPDAEVQLQAELARFEWALAAAFDAAPGQPATIASLATVAASEWPALRFRAVPALRRLATTTNAVAAWRAARATEAEEPAAAAPRAERGARIEWLVLRPALDTQFRSLPADEARALDRLLDGASFGELCGTLAAELGDEGAAALAAAGWLKGWIGEGALERV
ncbi:MAG: putative DNA-binding domain-containing protein [Proteobacteria bacterium]|nr:putative DNA-binding domain-containing protein [Pseudomonadota bacterium]